ncbi:MAG: phytanoyl-CoA dioxygenase family protein [Chloroflexi bacterium]|nr:phytanoyl-CoA dioxygenase family protein [Chloroflexota bacterium]
MPGLELIAYETVEELAEAVRRDGFAYMPGVLSPAEVAELRRRIDSVEPNPRANDRREQSPRRGIDPSSGEATTFYQQVVNMLFNRSAYFLPFLDRSPVAEVADAVMGDDCHCISMTGWVTGPGRLDQDFHSDYQPIELPSDVMADPRVEIPVFTATAHYYLDDLDNALGPTNFIPGSHRAGRKPRDGEISFQGVNGQNILCNAGDVVLFRSDVWHRGTANTSSRIRYLLQVHYGRRMVVQKFPPYLDFRFDPAILAQATPRQRRYLGEHPFSNYD